MSTLDNILGNNNARSNASVDPGGQIGFYVQRLMRLGVPRDVAIRVGLGAVKLQNARRLAVEAGGSPMRVQMPAVATPSAPSNPAAQSELMPATSQASTAQPRAPSFNLPVLSHPRQAQFLRPGQPFLTPDGRMKRAT